MVQHLRDEGDLLRLAHVHYTAVAAARNGSAKRLRDGWPRCWAHVLGEFVARSGSVRCSSEFGTHSGCIGSVQVVRDVFHPHEGSDRDNSLVIRTSGGAHREAAWVWGTAGD